MARDTKATMPLLVGLLILCVVPALGGGARIIEILVGGNMTVENARFFASPFPVVLHIVASLVFSIGGAFQLFYAPPRSTGARHKLAGRALVFCGMLASLSGLWMTQFYPRAVTNFDGHALYFVRLLVGAAMTFAICCGVQYSYRRDFVSHRNWMVRAYALGLGAGTQVFTHIPWFVFPELRSELLRTFCMGAGWVINAVVAEWLIIRLSRPRPVADGLVPEVGQ